MKSVFSFLLTAALAVTLLPAFSCAAEETGDDDRFAYTIADGAATITGYLPQDGDETTLTLPDSLGGCPVTALGDSAFAQACVAETVIFPDTLTEIGENCFSGCSYLTSLTFPDSLQSIGYQAFYQCGSLKTISVPDTLSTVDVDAFASTAWQNNATDTFLILGDGLLYRYLGTEATATIPDTVKTICAYSFLDAQNLETLTIPDSVTTILDGAFEYCLALSEIRFPAHLDKLAGDALVLTKWFSDYPDDCVVINDVLYKYKGGAQTVSVPDTVHIVGETAFERCLTVEEVQLPPSVTALRYAAFYHCDALKTITLPESLTQIDDMAFYGCVSLREVTCPQTLATLGARVFASCPLLRQLLLPSGVQKIGEMAAGYAYVDGQTGYVLQEDFHLYSDSSVVQEYAAAAGISIGSAADLPAEVQIVEEVAPQRRSFSLRLFVITVVAVIVVCGALFQVLRRLKKR